ncbi:MFS transporter [Marisediminicola senii]|uniref:MFS transporter n=1 Tax=Marisediminicola senii TaxID=2711233 RepID=UPI0013ECB92F|nr:MFS transporter [Marisediminicola senii]
MTTEEPPFRWRGIALPALLPTLLFSIGEGAIIPVIPIVADRLDASLAVAGLIAAMLMVGQLIGDVPSGWLISRVGERAAMIGAAFIAVIALTGATIAPNEWVLGAAVLVIGIATAVFALARHAFMTTFVPLAYRARALSTLGGTFRLGLFIGPFLAAGVILLTGSTSAVFLIHVIGCLGAAATLLLMRDPSATFGPRVTGGGGSPSTAAGDLSADGSAAAAASTPAPRLGLFATLRANRGVLARLGMGAALVGALRASRSVIVPLWAVSIGLGGSETALIIGIAGGIDFALFYVSGQIMDRYGRLWTALPSMIGLGAGHLLLATSHDLPGNVTWFIAVAMVLAVANGLGSGLLMTMGADLADRRNPAPFLGAWRFTGDLGGASAPLLIAGVTAVSSIAIASGVMGVLGIVGAGVLLRYLPRYVPRSKL